MARIKPKPPADLASRVRALQQRLRKARLAALLVTNPRDIRYLTGFVGDDSWALVPAASWPVILTDFRFEEQVQREAPHLKAHIRKKGLVDELGTLLKRRPKSDKVALQAEHVSLALRKRIDKQLGWSRFTEWDDKLIDQRAVKDDGEVQCITCALDIQQRAYLETLAQLKPGQSEAQVAAFLEYRMRTMGADGCSFPTIVAVDANAALPHAIPGPVKAGRGSLVLIDWGARYGGYCGDLTRTVALGRMTPRMREVYQVVLDAQLAAIDAIAPGKKLREVDAVARRVIRKAGYEKQFGHGLGHGIGLDIHEQPTLSPRAAEDAVLEVGQVVTVEPGVYLPGVGGVRIEDDVLVEPHGGRVLSDLPKSLDSAII